MNVFSSHIPAIVQWRSSRTGQGAMVLEHPVEQKLYIAWKKKANRRLGLKCRLDFKWSFPLFLFHLFSYSLCFMGEINNSFTVMQSNLKKVMSFDAE